MSNFEEQIRYDTRGMTKKEKAKYIRQHERDFGFEEGELDYLIFEEESNG